MLLDMSSILEDAEQLRHDLWVCLCQLQELRLSGRVSLPAEEEQSEADEAFATGLLLGVSSYLADTKQRFLEARSQQA